jgi:alpha-tubulin suppressor-like RCC1 family protein
VSPSSRSRRSRALATLLAVVASSGAALACSAIVGVEDVTLARNRDAARVVDLEGSVDDDAPVDLDASTGPIEPSVHVAAGFNHTCARQTSGKVQCWGDNGAGQVGDGVPFGGTRNPITVPQDVAGLTDAIALASGVSHSCAIRRGGTVVCWGINSFGQLGDGTLNRSSSPVAVQGVGNSVAIAAGTSFTCALIQGGTVQCWGANYAGQLGDGTKIDRPTAAPVQQLTGATAIATAEYHACAVVAGGAVTCWGKNTDGQLGNGSIAESLLPSLLTSLSDIVQVVAASRFTCARASSGQINCWGANNLGQLGTGSPNDAPNPSPALNVVSDAVDLWVGYEHGCAVRRAGEVRCWGSAGNGQVGSGSVPDDASIPKPTAVVGVSGALVVSTGGDHSCATTAKGAVLCWGANGLGQLGNGSNARAYAAVPVTGYP